MAPNQPPAEPPRRGALAALDAGTLTLLPLSGPLPAKPLVDAAAAQTSTLSMDQFFDTGLLPEEIRHADQRGLFVQATYNLGGAAKILVCFMYGLMDKPCPFEGGSGVQLGIKAFIDFGLFSFDVDVDASRQQDKLVSDDSAYKDAKDICYVQVMLPQIEVSEGSVIQSVGSSFLMWRGFGKVHTLSLSVLDVVWQLPGGKTFSTNFNALYYVDRVQGDTYVQAEVSAGEWESPLGLDAFKIE